MSSQSKIPLSTAILNYYFLTSLKEGEIIYTNTQTNELNRGFQEPLANSAPTWVASDNFIEPLESTFLTLIQHKMFHYDQIEATLENLRHVLLVTYPGLTKLYILIEDLMKKNHQAQHQKALAVQRHTYQTKSVTVYEESPVKKNKNARTDFTTFTDTIDNYSLTQNDTEPTQGDTEPTEGDTEPTEPAESGCGLKCCKSIKSLFKQVGAKLRRLAKRTE